MEERKLELRDSIIPICNDLGIQGTGFIVQHRGCFILITAGHTFYSTSEVYSTEGWFFEYENEKYSLEELRSQVKFREYPDEDQVYTDYAFFGLSGQNYRFLNLIHYEEEGNEAFDCYGFDKGKINCQDRSGGKSPVPAKMSFEIFPDKYQMYNVINCRTKFGAGIPGYSGGPIVRKNTQNVVGMTVRADCRKNIRDQERRQHFIISDFLLEELELFTTR